MKSRRKNTGKRKKKRPPLPKNKPLVAVLSVAVFLVFSAVLAQPALRSDLFGLFGITANTASLEVVEIGETDAESGTFDAATVSFLDVGQGDAVLLECNGEYALIDAGSADAEESLIADLQTLGVPSLRYLIMTHPHEDHIGGMQAVLNMIPVQTILLPDLTKAELPTTVTFETLIQRFLEEELPSEVMQAGMQYPLGNGLLHVLCGSLENDDNYNLLSPILLFEVGDFQYLSAGDAEKENEQWALSQGVPLTADLYKASHHGSSTSNTSAFMHEVNPSLTVICYGEDNRYGHPHREALAAFDEVNTTVLSTAENGLIRVHANENGEWVVEAEQTHLPFAA